MATARALSQDSSGLSLVRLRTALGTAINLILAGRAGNLFGRLLTVRRLGPGSCLVLVG